MKQSRVSIPNDDVKPWAKRIGNEKEDMMIVGHLPFLEKMASYGFPYGIKEMLAG